LAAILKAMKRITLITLLLCVCGIANAQPVLSPWRPPVGCSTNDVLKFNGTSWVCGSVSGFSTNNVIPKGNGTGLTASSWTDDGTTSTTTGSVTLGDATGDVVQVSGNTTYFGTAGGNGYVYITGDEVDFHNGDNSTQAGYINWRGYASGQTQYRNLIIGDGRGVAVATFTGSDKSVDFDGDLVKFGTTGGDGAVYIRNGGINSAYNINANGTLWINEIGYQGGTTQFRDVNLMDGKSSTIALFTGATKTLTLNGPARLISADAGTNFAAGNWTAGGFTTFGPNAGNTSTGAALGIGYSTTSDEAQIAAVAPSTGWKKMAFAANQFDFRPQASSTVGVTIATSGVTTIKTGAATAALTPAGTVLALEQADGISNFLYIKGNTSKFLAFGNGNNALDGGMSYDSGAARMLALISANTSRLSLDSDGSIFMGDTATTLVGSNVDVLKIGNTGTGQTTTAKSLLTMSHTGSFDTSAGQKVTVGTAIAMNATRSAGAFNLTQKALVVDASGAQENTAIETVNGDNRFNVSGGQSTFFAFTQFNSDVELQSYVMLGGNASHIITVNGTMVFNTPLDGAGITNGGWNGKHIEWSEEFMNTPSTTAGAGGRVVAQGLMMWDGGTCAVAGAASANHPGVASITPNATGGVCSWSEGTDTNKTTFATGETWTAELGVSINTLADGTAGKAHWMTFGYGTENNVINQSNGCYFLYDDRNLATGAVGALNQAKWECWCAFGNTRTKYVMDGVAISDGSFATVNAPVVVNTYKHLKVKATSTGSGTGLAEFFVDGVKSCQITSNIPTNTGMSPTIIMAQSSATGTSGTFNIDWARFAVDLAAPRG
jgi:hypothetical protein